MLDERNSQDTTSNRRRLVRHSQRKTLTIKHCRCQTDVWSPHQYTVAYSADFFSHVCQPQYRTG